MSQPKRNSPGRLKKSGTRFGNASATLKIGAGTRTSTSRLVLKGWERFIQTWRNISRNLCKQAARMDRSYLSMYFCRWDAARKHQKDVFICLDGSLWAVVGYYGWLRWYPITVKKPLIFAFIAVLDDIMAIDSGRVSLRDQIFLAILYSGFSCSVFT